MISIEKCNLCPHRCLVNRKNNEKGFCNSDSSLKIALTSVFYYEEPCISGKNGSGAVFFSNCNLKCVYCQNYKISSGGKGDKITIEDLADIFIDFQNKKVNNINLVTPTIYALQIKEAIILARKKGLNIPIIYNSSGYENIETLKELNGFIDIYLPDFKYSDNKIALKYSGISNYVENAKMSILEMYNQVGLPKFNKEGIIQKGVIVRNLILPNNVKNTKEVLKWIKDNIGKDAYISIMAQYFPTNKANMFPEINRKINKKELSMIENYIYKLGFDNGYIQNIENDEEKYVPDF